MSKIKPTLPKGTRDFGTEVMVRREYIFETIRSVFRKYGYAPLETPAMENLAVLTGKYGEEGDRLIFKILNSGEYFEKAQKKAQGPIAELGSNALTPLISEKALRYDLTVPFARYVVMNQSQLAFPFKRYQIQPVWRADRPQKGRYREFYQCDADVVGSDSLLYEAELAAIYQEAFDKLGFQEIEVQMNHRMILNGIAERIGMPEKVTDICISIDKLDKIGREGVEGELGRRGIPADQFERIFEIVNLNGSVQEKLDFLENAFSGIEKGSQGVREMGEVFGYLDAFGISQDKIKFDLSLARGLDYYTGTIYEVKCPPVKIGSLGGGGRYADLTGIFGLNGMSGVGVSFGAARIYDAMEELGLFTDLPLTTTKVLLINFGGESLLASLKTLGKLREAGIPAEIYPEDSKLNKQFKYADRKSIPYTLIIGEEEVKSGTFALKNMQTGEQSKVSMEDLLLKLA